MCYVCVVFNSYNQKEIVKYLLATYEQCYTRILFITTVHFVNK